MSYFSDDYWRQSYKAKAQLMADRGYAEVSPFDFYRELFPLGSLSSGRNDRKANIIASQIRDKESGQRTRQWIVGDDLVGLDRVFGDRFGLIPPLSFFGKTHTGKNAHELFALAIDIDYVGVQQLKNMLKQFGNGVQLCPTYLVSSGKGVHLYYFLDNPVEMYAHRVPVLTALKEDLIRRHWNDTSTVEPDDPDITGILQGFRCVGSLSKLGEGFPVRAWRLCDNRYTLEQIKASIPSCTVDLTQIYEKPEYKKSKYTLEEAKRLYPDWYQSKIVEGNPLKRTWTCNIALYEWWKRQMHEQVRAGGRYYAIMALCAFGLKCGVSERQIKEDAFSFLDVFEQRTEEEGNHFTRRDIQDALRALKADKKLISTLASRAWIEKSTKVSIPPRKRRKKPLKRDDGTALKAARMLQDLQDPDGTWRNKEGRPSKQQIVQQWQREHPDGRKVDCIRETGLTKPTVYRWWEARSTD